jgi:site-specific DNA-cytosine methylase
MRILVACEESQAVTKALRALGHEAYSADIVNCSGGHPEWHIKGDVLLIVKNEWDMIIAHPPCTYFASAGMHYLKTKPERKEHQDDAFRFLLEIWNCGCKKIAIENPNGWLNTNWMKPTQTIQPYMFGHKELKTTSLWLKGLKPLTATNDVGRPEPLGYVIRKSGPNKGKRYNYYWRQGKSAKQRSKTFPGIAKAMAEQWAGHIDTVDIFESQSINLLNKPLTRKADSVN